MASLKELKGRINSVKSTQKITKAKQMVAAAKLRRAQAAAEAARPYKERMEAVVGALASKVGGSAASPLLVGTGSDNVHLVIVATSDKGLCGGFNSNIAKAAREYAAKLIADGKQVKFYNIGRKGRASIRRFFPDMELKYFDTTEIRNIGFDEAQAISKDLISLLDAGEFDVAHLFYGKFRSALVQEPTRQQLIPVVAPEVTEHSGAVVDYEPSEEDILNDLLPKNVSTQLLGAFLENAASEQGASMTAMDNATRNAGDIISKLTIEYNRSRQAAITTELVEIISGAEAL